MPSLRTPVVFGAMAEVYFLVLFLAVCACCSCSADDCCKGAFPESYDQLNDTVKIFETMIDSSEEVLTIIEVLKRELSNIVDIKESLLESMNRLEAIVEKSAETTTEISLSTGEQVSGVKSILESLEQVQEGIGRLAGVLKD